MNQRHEFIDILVIAICAAICGADDWEAVALFWQSKAPWFKTFDGGGAAQFLAWTRTHWSIENSLHRVLNIVLRAGWDHDYLLTVLQTIFHSP